jgi:hypothetical protein
MELLAEFVMLLSPMQVALGASVVLLIISIVVLAAMRGK